MYAETKVLTTLLNGVYAYWKTNKVFAAFGQLFLYIAFSYVVTLYECW
jgi:hypothetical protein